MKADCLVEKTADVMVRMMDCLMGACLEKRSDEAMAPSLAEKLVDLMVRTMGYLCRSDLKSS